MMKKCKRIIALATVLCFIAQQPGMAQVTAIPSMASSRPAERTKTYFRPPHLRSLDYRGDGCSLLYDRGNAKNSIAPLEQSAGALFTYFLAGISLPNSAFWVNLRPDAPDGIIDPALAKTDVGTILLDADLQLKKDTARYTSPQTQEGKEYWRRLYAKAETVYGSAPAALPSLARPWIVPGEVIIKQSATAAHVYKAGLEVKLMDDRLSKGSGYDFSDARGAELNAYASGLMRELILPKLTREVNTAARYAALRQAFYSLVLAQWFKEKFKGTNGGLAGRIDTGSLEGIASARPCSPAAYFAQYRDSFLKGEYRVSEHAQSAGGETVRMYVSGGTDFSGILSGVASLRELGETVVRAGKVTIGTGPADAIFSAGKYLAAARTRGTTVTLDGPAAIADGGEDVSRSADKLMDRDIAERQAAARALLEKLSADPGSFTERTAAAIVTAVASRIPLSAGTDPGPWEDPTASDLGIRLLEETAVRRPELLTREAMKPLLREMMGGGTAAHSAVNVRRNIRFSAIVANVLEAHPALMDRELVSILTALRPAGYDARQDRFLLSALAQFLKNDPRRRLPLVLSAYEAGQPYSDTLADAVAGLIDTQLGIDLFLYLTVADGPGQRIGAQVLEIINDPVIAKTPEFHQFLIDNDQQIYSMFDIFAAEGIACSQELLRAAFNRRDASFFAIFQNLKEMEGALPEKLTEVMRKTLLPPKYANDCKVRRDILNRAVAVAFLMADFSEQEKDGVYAGLSAIVEEYNRRGMSAKTVVKRAQAVLAGVALRDFRAIVGSDIPTAAIQETLAAAPGSAEKIVNLTLLYLLTEESNPDTAEKAREALRRFLRDRDPGQFNTWLYTEAAWNRDEHRALLAAGFAPSLWGKGIRKTFAAGKAGETVTAAIEFDFLQSSFAGADGIPGCFNPFTGIHNEMPLQHALEANSGFVMLYDARGRMVGNAVVMLGDEGIFVQHLYSKSSRDLEWAVFEIVAQAVNNGIVPAAFFAEDISPSPGGFIRPVSGEKFHKKLLLGDEPGYDNLPDVDEAEAVFEPGFKMTREGLAAAGYRPRVEAPDTKAARDEDRVQRKREVTEELFRLGFRRVNLGPVLRNVERILAEPGTGKLDESVGLLRQDGKPLGDAEKRAIRGRLLDIKARSGAMADGGTRNGADTQTRWNGVMARIRAEVVARVNKERRAADGDKYTELEGNFVFDPETLAAFREILRERYITDPSAPDYKEISKAKHRITPERQRSMNLKTLGKGLMSPGNVGHQLRKFTRPTDREKASLYLIYSHGRGILARQKLSAQVESITGEKLPATINFSELRALGLISTTEKGIKRVRKGLFEALYSADSAAGDIKTWETLFDKGPEKDGGIAWLRPPLDALKREALAAAGKEASSAFGPDVLLLLRELLREKYINDASVFEDSLSSADDFRRREHNFKSLVKTTEARTALWKLLHLIAYPEEETEIRALRLIYSYGYGDGRALLPEVLARRERFRIPSSINVEWLEFLGMATREGKVITGVNKENFLTLFPSVGQPEAAAVTAEDDEAMPQWRPIFDELKQEVVNKLNSVDPGGAQRKTSDPFDPDSLAELRRLLREKYVNSRASVEYKLMPLLRGRKGNFAMRAENLQRLRGKRMEDSAFRALVTLVAYPDAAREQVVLGLLYAYPDYGTRPFPRKELWKGAGSPILKSINFGLLEYLGLLRKNHWVIFSVNQENLRALYPDIEAWSEKALADGGTRNEESSQIKRDALIEVLRGEIVRRINNRRRVDFRDKKSDAYTPLSPDFVFGPETLRELGNLLREQYINDTAAPDRRERDKPKLGGITDNDRTKNLKRLASGLLSRDTVSAILKKFAYPTLREKISLFLIYSHPNGGLIKSELDKMVKEACGESLPASINFGDLECLGLISMGGEGVSEARREMFEALYSADSKAGDIKTWGALLKKTATADAGPGTALADGGSSGPGVFLRMLLILRADMGWSSKGPANETHSLKLLREHVQSAYCKSGFIIDDKLEPLRQRIYGGEGKDEKTVKKELKNIRHQLQVLVRPDLSWTAQYALYFIYTHAGPDPVPYAEVENFLRANGIKTPLEVILPMQGLQAMGLLKAGFGPPVAGKITDIDTDRFEALYPGIKDWGAELFRDNSALADGGKEHTAVKILRYLRDTRMDENLSDAQAIARIPEVIRSSYLVKWEKPELAAARIARERKTILGNFERLRKQFADREILMWFLKLIAAPTKQQREALAEIYAHNDGELFISDLRIARQAGDSVRERRKVFWLGPTLQFLGLITLDGDEIIAVDHEKFRTFYKGIDAWENGVAEETALADGGSFRPGVLMHLLDILKDDLKKELGVQDLVFDADTIKLMRAHIEARYCKSGYVIDAQLESLRKRIFGTAEKDEKAVKREIYKIHHPLQTLIRPDLNWTAKYALSFIYSHRDDDSISYDDLEEFLKNNGIKTPPQSVLPMQGLQALGFLTAPDRPGVMGKITNVDGKKLEAFYGEGIANWGSELGIDSRTLADGGTAGRIIAHIQRTRLEKGFSGNKALVRLQQIIRDDYVILWEKPERQTLTLARERERRMRNFDALRKALSVDRSVLMWTLKLIAYPNEQQRDALAEIYVSEDGPVFVSDLRISRQAAAARARNQVVWLSSALQSLGLVALEGDEIVAVERDKFQALYPELGSWREEALADGGAQSGWKAVFETLRNKIAIEINNRRGKAAKEEGRAEFEELGPGYSFDPETLITLKKILRNQYINDVNSPDYSLSRAVRGSKSPDKIRAENLKALRKGKIGDAPLRKLLKIIAYPEPDRERPLLYAIYSHDYGKNGALVLKDLPGVTGFATPSSFNCEEFAYLGLVTRDANAITGVNRENFLALYEDIERWGAEDHSISADGGTIKREGDLEDLLRRAPKERTYEVEELMIEKEQAKAFFTFDQYMDEALFNPKWGYYTSRPSIGSSRDGYDFSTYPESLSPVFGQMVGARIYDLYRSMRQGGVIAAGERFEILEFGAGNGTLARDVLAYFAAAQDPATREFYQNLRYTIGERSQKLREIQASRLEPFKKKIRVEPADARDPDSFKRKGFKGVVVSNELPDAFGTHKVRVGRGYLRDRSFEVCVAIPTQNPAVIAATLPRELARKIISGSGRFGLPFHLDTAYISRDDFLAAMEYLAGPGQEGARQDFVKALRFKEAYADGADFPEIAEYLSMNEAVINNRLSSRPASFVIPVNTASGAYMRSVGALLNQPGNAGYAITIDYGGSGEHLLSGRLPPEKMIRCYGQNAQWDDNPYFLPGERDITADINFSYLNRIGESAGLRRSWYGPQGTLYMPGERYRNAVGDKDLRSAEELTLEYAGKFTRFISRTGGFQVLVQSSDTIPADKRYQYPQYGRAGGLPRGAALEPNEMIFVRAEMARDSDVLFDDAIEARLEAAGVPDAVELLARIEDLAEYHHELTGSLLLFMGYEPEVAQKAVSILSSSGLLDFGMLRPGPGIRKDGGTAAPGGIDLRRIPRAEMSAASGAFAGAIASLDVEKELAALEAMVERAMRPSPGRVCDFAAAARGARGTQGRLRDCVAALIRLDEDAAEPTAPELVSLLFASGA